MRIVLTVALAALAACGATQRIVWDFEGDDLSWRPRTGTVAVEKLAEPGATEESHGVLRVAGPIEEGWNYAISDTKPMQPDQLYRLSAWVKVDRLGTGTQAPYLKCEFLDAENDSLGRSNTEPYDAAKLGEWQLLTGEFRAPADAAKFWLALEKGGNTPMEIEARLDGVTMEHIDRLTIHDHYRLDPVPEPLEALRGVHPRIYLTSDRIAELRAATKTTHRGLWEEVKAHADNAADREPPEYIEDDGHSGDEQLWQRGVGNTMPVLAMAWVLSEDPKYLDAARAWALASCAYPTWGLGRIDGMDLASGHQLFGLGIVYDWCYEGLGAEARATIRDTLVRRTSAMFEAAAGGAAWWRRSYLQNHLWVNIAGMSVAGFALFDEVEGATMWIGLPREKFRTTMEALGPDGASHEGVGYWQYGVEYMMKFLHLDGQLLGEDIVGDGQWWPNTAAYYMYMTTPRNSWSRTSSIVDIADCPRGNWYGPDYLLRGLAWEYRDGHAQWFADQVDEADIDSAGARWLNLIWYDPSVPATPPTDLPTLKHFSDMDIVSARSDWSGDESLVVLKCGPYIGHDALEAFSYDPGGGHVHPDAGHFILFANGEYLIRDDGYRAKWTGQHNTLLVSGRGQLGEGRQWFSGAECLATKAAPRVLSVESTEAMDTIICDATEAYPSDIGLRSFRRCLLFVKPDCLIVLDDIEAEAGTELELRLHPESSECGRDGEAFVVTGEHGSMRIELSGGSTSSGEIAGEDRHAGGGEFSVFTIGTRTKLAETGSWRPTAAITWAPAGREPARVTREGSPDRPTFRIGDRTVSFDWGSLKTRVE